MADDSSRNSLPKASSQETLEHPDFAVGAAEAETLLQLSGVVANYSPASLAAIDYWMQQWKDPKGTESSKGKPPISWEWILGCYLGELFCQRFGAAWRPGGMPGQPSRDPLCYHVAWPSGFMTCPFVYIAKRMESGLKSSIYGQFEQCRQILRERGDIADMADDPADWLQQGEAFGFRLKWPAVGIQFIQTALKRNPSLPMAWLRLGQLCLETAEGEASAVPCFRRAISIDPAFAEAWMALVRHLKSKGREEEALAESKKALQPVPDHLELQEVLGELLLARGEIPQAAAAFQKATRGMRPAGAWEGLGLCRLASGDQSGALEAFQQAVQKESTRLAAAMRIADLQEKSNQLAESAEWYRHILQYGPRESELVQQAGQRLQALESRTEFLHARAARLASSGKTKEAIEVYEQIVSRNARDADAWRDAGVGYALLKQFDKALSCLDKAIQAAPGDPRNYDHKAVTLGRMGRFPACLDVLDQGLFQCAQTAPLWSRRAYILGRLGRWQEALTNAGKALEQSPDLGQSWLYKAEAERHLGQTDPAIASLGKYIAWALPGNPPGAREAMRMKWELEHPDRKLDPQQAEASQALAFQLQEAGRYQEALQAFEQATRLDPFHFEIWNNYGTLWSLLGQNENALACFRRAAELHPHIPTFQTNMAISLERLGRLEEALACHEKVLASSPNEKRCLEESIRIRGLLQR